MSDENELVDLGAMAKAECLPAIVGFTPEHESITTLLIRRVIGHLSGNVKSQSYGIQDMTWHKGVQETLTVNINENIKLTISLETHDA